MQKRMLSKGSSSESESESERKLSKEVRPAGPGERVERTESARHDKFKTTLRETAVGSYVLHGTLKQMVKYDPNYVDGFRAIAWALEGDHRAVLRTLAQCVSFGIVAFVIAFKSGAQEDTLSSVDDIRVYLTGMVQFMLGFYIAVMVGRWWSMRDNCLGKFWGAVDDMCLLVGAAYPGPANSKLRVLIIRYGLLALHLTFKQNRGELTAEGLQGLVDREILHEDERTLLLARLVQDYRDEAHSHTYTSLPQVVWCWMASIFFRLNREGKLEDNMLMNKLYGMCVDARGGIGALYAHTDTQVPFIYVFLLGFIVMMHNTIVAIKGGVGIAVAIRAVGSPELAEQGWGQICANMFRILVVPCIYRAFLELGTALSDPLGEDFLDFPLEAYHMIMRNEGETFLHAGSNPPSSVVEAVKEAAWK